MKSPSKSIVDRRIYQFTLFLGPITTLLISPWTNYDPINLIKILFVSTIAFGLIGLIISNTKSLKQKISRPLIFISAGFLFFLFLPLITTSAPISQQFWGMQGRNTGILAYTSLTFVLIGASLIQDLSKFRSILNGLILAAVFNTLYCIIQIAKIDPIKWSEYQPFGTLGNVNFLSSFLGMTCLVCSILAFEEKLQFSRKFLLMLLVLIDLLIIIKTQSIQGLMIYFAGGGIALFIFILKRFKNLFINLLVATLGSLGFILTVAALVNKGPLKSLIFQRSIEFRGDYIHAGWAMSVAHPLTGIGVDSYGDWYRYSRGLLSTIRTGPDRVANTSHNIFLDISSSGGFVLLAFYLGFLFLAFRKAFLHIRNTEKFDFLAVAIFSAWLAYQIQACISINQVGVGIWNWILTGLLIGYPLQEVETKEKNMIRKPGIENKKIKNRDKGSLTLNPGVSVITIALSVIGFLLALIPWKADADFRTALDTRDLNKIVKATDLPGITAFHYGIAIDAAIQNNFGEQAYSLDKELIKRFPRDYYGWRVLSILSSATESERELAKNKLQELDPFNPTTKK